MKQSSPSSSLGGATKQKIKYTMAIFKINKEQARKVLRTNLENYIRDSYSYFRNNKRTEKEVKIVMGREYITIHIKTYYCVICNDLKFLNNQGLLIASNRSLKWLKNYE